MPELPEVETFRLQTELIFKNLNIREIKTSGLMTTLQDDKVLASVSNLKLINTFRHGKYLFIEFNGTPAYLIFHFGMSGSLKVNYLENSDMENVNQKHSHLTIYFSDCSGFSFIDPRRFGSIRIGSIDSIYQIISGLGPDATRDEFNFKYLKEAVKSRSAPIKTLLLDQHLVAGLGNIYVAEILFAAGISPMRPAGKLTESELKQIVRNTKLILKRAIRALGSTLTDKGYSDIYGNRGTFQNQHKCYGLEGIPCKTCGGAIVRTIVAQRSTFFCPNCQI